MVKKRPCVKLGRGGKEMVGHIGQSTSREGAEKGKPRDTNSEFLMLLFRSTELTRKRENFIFL